MCLLTFLLTLLPSGKTQQVKSASISATAGMKAATDTMTMKSMMQAITATASVIKRAYQILSTKYFSEFGIYSESMKNASAVHGIGMNNI